MAHLGTEQDDKHSAHRGLSSAALHKNPRV
jgi:hypothetical protein